MKALISISIFLLTLSCKQSTNIAVTPTNYKPITSVGCLAKYATNFGIKALTEDGSCEFNYCDDQRFSEYNEAVHAVALDYISKHGELLDNGDHRVKRKCIGEKLYCSHPSSINYQPGPYPKPLYTREYCFFRACQKPDFKGYEKFIEFKEFLNTHEGEIARDDSDKYCERQTIFTETVDVLPKIKDSKFNSADISFILDDSGSMGNEIEAVKKALIELAPSFKTMSKDINLSFHRMSDIQKKNDDNPKSVYPIRKIDSSGRFLFGYGLPESIGNVLIKKDKDVDLINQEIKQVLGNFEIKNGFGHEQGLCLTLRHLRDLQKKGFEDKKQYISIIITDEDEHYKNESYRCFSTFISDENMANGVYGHLPFRDNNNESYHISSFKDMYETLAPKQQEAYGWIGLFFDENNSVCRGAQAHAETYLDFTKALDQLGAKHEVGDICENDYTALIRDKLIDGFLDEITLEFKFFTHSKNININFVDFVLKNGTRRRLTSSEYKITQNGDEYFISIDESLKNLIYDLSKMEINFTYKKD